MRILIVDDEPIVIKQLNYLIGKLHPKWEIIGCTDGIQAQKVLKRNNIQLAFLDIELPGQDGLNLAQHIKRDFTNINIIMISAYQDFNYAKSSIEIGVDFYLTKPIIEDELKKALNKYRNYQNYSSIVLDAIDFIRENYSGKISLATVAEHVHVNPSYLSRRFHEETGKRLFDFIIDYRLEMSKKKLIKNRTHNISSIANSCGFNSLHYFSSTFKRRVGMAPKEFREEGYLLDGES